MLHVLLEEVLDDPARNTPEYLEGRALELSRMEDDALRELGEKGRERKADCEEQEVVALRKKHHVS
jgi:hypothetical protein